MGKCVRMGLNLEGFVDISASLRCGVYALAAKGVVIYVGKSKRMLGRINSHRSAWADKRKGKAESWIAERLGIPGLLFDQVWVRPCRPDELDALEADMINLYKPRYNTRLKTSAKIAVPHMLTINGIAISLCAKPQPIERRL